MAKIGIKELAELVGVSTATVSRALNTPELVSEKVREKVQTTAKQVGYYPNSLGASLRRSSSKMIIAAIPDISDSFISGMISSLKQTASRRGYSVLLGDTGGDREQELLYGNMVLSSQADGIIVFSHRLPFRDEDMQLKSFTFPPLVNSCEPINTSDSRLTNLPYISINNRQAGKDLTQHLIDLGHKEIAIITGNWDSPSAQDRLQGYKDALSDARIPYKPDLVYKGKYVLKYGVTCTKEILARKNRPTAIIAMCDETAIGVMATLREFNYDVPNDISVAGIDNILFAEHLNPSLTTIAQPTKSIGKYCADTLIDLIEGKTIEKQNNILEHKLIVRESTAPPNTNN